MWRVSQMEDGLRMMERSLVKVLDLNKYNMGVADEFR